MKIYSESAGIGEEPAAPVKSKSVKTSRANYYYDDLMFPDLWESALLPEEFVDLNSRHTQQRLQNKDPD